MASKKGERKGRRRRRARSRGEGAVGRARLYFDPLVLDYLGSCPGAVARCLIDAFEEIAEKPTGGNRRSRVGPNAYEREFCEHWVKWVTHAEETEVGIESVFRV